MQTTNNLFYIQQPTNNSFHIDEKTNDDDKTIHRQNHSQLTFQPLDLNLINAQSFIDLSSIDVSYSSLKMMAMIHEGELYLISGKNTGLSDTLTESIINTPALHQYCAAKLSFEIDPEIKLTNLWVNTEKKLCMSYQLKDELDLGVRVAQLDIVPCKNNESLFAQEQHLAIDLILSSTNCSDETPTLTLANRQVHARLDADPSFLWIEDAKIKLPLEANEKITGIKTCGETLQLSTRKNANSNKIYYLDARHLDKVSPKTLPIMTDMPPLAFSHFAVNNNQSFHSANPFIKNRINNIPTPKLPLAGWINGFRQRIDSGQKKWQRGRNGAALVSFAKALDPGALTLGRFLQQTLSRKTSTYIREEVITPLKQEIAAQKKHSKHWDALVKNAFYGSTSNDLHAKSEQAVKEALRQYYPAHTKSNNSSLSAFDTISTDQNPPLKSTAQTNADAQLAQELKDQIRVSKNATKAMASFFIHPSSQGKDQLRFFRHFSQLSNKLNLIISSPQFELKFKDKIKEADNIKTIQKNILACMGKGAGILNYQDVELLFPYLEQTLFNIEAYLAINSDEGDLYDAFKQKMAENSTGTLMQSIKQSLLSYQAVRQSRITYSAIGQSLRDPHIGLGKVWMHVNDKITPQTEMIHELAKRLNNMADSDSICLSSDCSADANPFDTLIKIGTLGQVSGGLIGRFEKDFDLNLTSSEGKIQFQFIQKTKDSLCLKAKAGGHFNHLNQVINCAPGTSTLSLDPISAAAALNLMQGTDKSFFFEVEKKDTEKILNYLFYQNDWQDNFNTNISNAQYRCENDHEANLNLTLNSKAKVQLGLKSGSTYLEALPKYQLSLQLQLNANLSIEHKNSLNIGDRTNSADSLTTLNLTASATLSPGSQEIEAKITKQTELDPKSPSPSMTLSSDETICADETLTKEKINPSEQSLSTEKNNALQQEESFKADTDPNIISYLRAKSQSDIRVERSQSNNENHLDGSHFGESHIDENHMDENHVTESDANESHVALNKVQENHITPLQEPQMMPHLYDTNKATNFIQHLLKIKSDLSAPHIKVLNRLLQAKEKITNNLMISADHKTKIDNAIIDLMIAIDRGHIEIHQTIAGNDIGKIIVSRCKKMTFWQKVADKIRAIFSIEPKHSQTLDQLMAQHPAGNAMFNNIKASSNSQSHNELIGRSSGIQAKVFYRLNEQQLFQITDDFATALNETEPNKAVTNMYKSLEFKELTGQPSYRLTAIEFIRKSIYEKKQNTALNEIAVLLNSTLTLTGRLGQITFEYDPDEDSTSPTTPTPKDIRNQTHGSLMSVMTPF